MQITQQGQPVPFTAFRFAGGESHVKLGAPLRAAQEVTVTARLRSGDDVMQLLLTVDAIERAGVGAHLVTLVLPYLPYARQDRVMVSGEPFSLKVFARLVNALGVHEVRVFDAHSDVGPALIDRCRVQGSGEAAATYIRQRVGERPFVLIAPDAGAYKKTERLASTLGVPVVVATKYRSVVDGSLAAPDVLGDVRGKVCVIVDDICDGGGTFLNLADALTTAGAAECHLFVSHGIFSKGYDALRARFASIGTTDAFRDASEYPQDLTVINLVN